MEGVVAFLDAKTIKTGNLFVFAQGGFDSENDEEVRIPRQCTHLRILKLILSFI